MKLRELKMGKINITWFFLIGIVLLSLTVLGIFLDVQLSTSLLNIESKFSTFIDEYGNVPGYAMFIVATAIMAKIFFKDSSDKRQRVLGIFTSVIMIVAVTYLAVRNVDNDLDFGWNFLIVGLIYTIAFITSFIFVDKSFDELELFRVGLLIIIISVISLGLNGFLFNNLFIRNLPRVIKTSWSGSVKPMGLFEMVFSPFSNSQSSFISGHATSATLLISLPLAFSVFKGDSKLGQIIALSCAIIYMIVIYIARLVGGLNYLTDLTIASIIVLAIIILTVYLDALRASKVKTE